MKLRNKLIPFMSVLATTTVVAPIITSCANVNNVKMVDITKTYIPTIEKAKKTPKALTAEEAQDLYFAHLSANPEILTQDVLKYEADRLPSRIKEIECTDEQGHVQTSQQHICSNVQAQVGVGNVSFKKVSTVVSNSDPTTVSFYALSCTIKYVFSYTTLNFEGTKQNQYTVEFTSTLKDIPTELEVRDMFNPEAAETTQKWYVVNNFADSKYLDAVPGWSYSFDKVYKTKTTYIENGEKKSVDGGYTRNGVINRKEQIKDILKISAQDLTVTPEYFDSILSFESYHLSDVKCPESTLPELGLADTLTGEVTNRIGGEWKLDGANETERNNGFSTLIKPFKAFSTELQQIYDKCTTPGNEGSFSLFINVDSVPSTIEQYQTASGSSISGQLSPGTKDNNVTYPTCDNLTHTSYDVFYTDAPEASRAEILYSDGTVKFGINYSTRRFDYDGDAMLSDDPIENGVLNMQSNKLALPYIWHGTNVGDYTKYANNDATGKFIPEAETFDFTLIEAHKCWGYAYWDGEKFGYREFTNNSDDAITMHITVVDPQ